MTSRPLRVSEKPTLKLPWLVEFQNDKGRWITLASRATEAKARVVYDRVMRNQNNEA